MALGFEKAAKLDAFWDKCIQHLQHAREKHPAFVERIISRTTPLANEYLAGVHKKRLTEGVSTLEDALTSELHEFLVEADRKDQERMIEEAADIVAILLRYIAGDMEVKRGALKKSNPLVGKMEGVQMPTWCKEGAWVMDDDDLTQINEIDHAYIWGKVADRDVTMMHPIDRARELKPVRFRKYSFEEAKSLLGKVMEYKDKGTSTNHSILICRVSKSEDFDTVLIHSCPLEDWQEMGATIGGVPIGVPEVDEDALKGGEK
jgi:hypothetical protein